VLYGAATFSEDIDLWTNPTTGQRQQAFSRTSRLPGKSANDREENMKASNGKAKQPMGRRARLCRRRTGSSHLPLVHCGWIGR
jgi:hypothetical protein